MNEPTELNERILEALAVAVEVTGATLTPPAIKIMVAKLQQHPEAAVLKAIDRAMEEVHGRLSLASILERLKADREDDGRPSAEEAWAQVGTDDERLTLVTTDEAMRACGEVRLLIEQGDMVAARMSFKDAYARIVSENRAHGIPVKWMASLGFDNAGQVRALTAAVQSGKLDAQYAADLIGVEPAVLLGKAQPLARVRTGTLPPRGTLRIASAPVSAAPRPPSTCANGATAPLKWCSSSATGNSFPARPRTKFWPAIASSTHLSTASMA